MNMLQDTTILYRPEYAEFKRNGVHFFVDGDRPNWASTDWRGAALLRLIDGRRTLKDLVRDYGEQVQVDPLRSWVHVRGYVQAALRSEMLSLDPIASEIYSGRASYLRPSGLNEFWVHTNNSCNLTCAHCLVSSHPGADPGPSTDHLLRVMTEAKELGVSRFYFTGGEPFLRKDIFELIVHATTTLDSELIVLTNATLFRGTVLKQLEALDRTRLKFQVSLDGATPEVNDPIRGEKTFENITRGIQTVVGMGIDISLTAVMTATNLTDLPKLPAVAKSLGVKSIHVMWMHRRGRILEHDDLPFPNNEEMLSSMRLVKQTADDVGVTLDNVESLHGRVNGRPGVKFDLSNACWDSLCLSYDGHVYPSASFAGHPGLDLGDTGTSSLRSLWLDSAVANTIRTATVANKIGVSTDPFRFILGGGDIEHSYFFSEQQPGENHVLDEDPYYGLYVELCKDIMVRLAESKRSAFNAKSGFDGPILFHVMGEGMATCGSHFWDTQVTTLHSNCVLAFNVETPHVIIQDFYSKAAEVPQPELCCTIDGYTEEELSHIPQEVRERSYGCGSPMRGAAIREGDTIVDLGSGGGIDCFVAARKTGCSGRVIGVDMTDSMLQVAERNRPPVSELLGYDIVEFRKGYLEEIPVQDKTADLVTSNCVINLSPDKKAVFSEIWRILKDGGRTVISDIVSERSVPPAIKVNNQLWGECIAGALTEEEFIASLEEAGFYGIELLQKVVYRDVEGHRFNSVTARGYKYEVPIEPSKNGYMAIYRGPMKMVMDEAGRAYHRGEAVPVSAHTAARLQTYPYTSLFTVIPPEHQSMDILPSTQSSGGSPAIPGEVSCCS
ncbi:MAG TPA: methyltransferase domain-containing protein [Nitrospirales bacterium]|nr:methyltransferase domain-containing protein [Nitrospirales bacterium]HIB55230.1 methyltransferase domain-containing protein [Nitrospirales bacterium]HIN32716.1 methyltransferase domain-containing protein [Nitrospirales bacterium]